MGTDEKLRRPKSILGSGFCEIWQKYEKTEYGKKQKQKFGD